MIDEGDVHGVTSALVELARQLAEHAGPLKDFDKAVAQFHREQASSAEAEAVSTLQGVGQTSLASQAVAHAALGAVSLIPGAGVVTAMTSPDAAAQSLDRLREGVRERRRARGGDEAGVVGAFVSELDRLSLRHSWVMLFLDTWEETGRYLDEWVRGLLVDGFGPLPANVIIVLAGRNELEERKWAALRSQVVDVPLEAFTEAEVRMLLAARGVTEAAVVEAVLQLSMGLPLLVELLAIAQPESAMDAEAVGELADVAVTRFVQWITDPWQREVVLSCALAPQLNEDIFAAVVSPEARGLWAWLCGQPFVTGHGGYKHYHSVVRASMIQQQRARSPILWSATHLRLASAHALWRAQVEDGLPRAKRWGDPRWRRHQLDELYHQLCAQPAAQLVPALEAAVQAAGADTATLRQFADTFEQAARDSMDPALRLWSDRLQIALAGDRPAMLCLDTLLRHGQLGSAARAWAHTYRGWHLTDHEVSVAEFDRAITVDPDNAQAWAYRGNAHIWLGNTGQAISDLSTSLGIDPSSAWTIARRGEARRQAGELDQAIVDFTAALALDPSSSWAFVQRGRTYQEAGRTELAISDYTAAVDSGSGSAWAYVARGDLYREVGRLDEAIGDFSAALALDANYAYALAQRAQTHHEAGRPEEASADFTSAIDVASRCTTDTNAAWTFVSRGIFYQQAGRVEEAIDDFTAALSMDPSSVWALVQRGIGYAEIGLFEEAVSDFSAAILIETADRLGLAWAHIFRGVRYHHAGRFEEAIIDFTAALTIDPKYVFALGQRGESRRRAGYYEEAINDFTLAIAAGAGFDGLAMSHRGESLRQIGRFEEAINDFTSALTISPNNVWFLGQRGVAHRQSNNFMQARTDLEQALSLEPDTPWILFELAMLNTLEFGVAACAVGWAELLAMTCTQPAANATRFFSLFQGLIIDHASPVIVAEEYLSRDPDQDSVTDLLHYLKELTGLEEEVVEGAGECRRVIYTHYRST
ncbi:tetratricopeptide repeat protein [Streptomyces goshikiensis]|uniref:tetratricopeptide repeat protein n=1 Tax=Streptomyces goshikiensis TaxID=1942 RepID=UPI0036AF2166